jgi:branched-chain amino acid transport system permease protein
MAGIRIFGALLLLSLLSAVPWILAPYYTGLIIQVMIYAIFAMSLDLLLGYTGLPSLGHAAYFGLAGYAVALFSTKLNAQIILILPAALALTAVIGFFFALLALRTQGV